MLQHQWTTKERTEMKPTFYQCPDCKLYYDDEGRDPGDGQTLEDIAFAYGADGWEQMPDKPCGCQHPANKYTVFVQQADGRGTTHIAVYDAANCEEAEKLALIQAAADWNGSPKDTRILGTIKGDVEVLKWAVLPDAGEPDGLCPDCGGSPHDETPHEYGCPRQRHQSYCAAVRQAGAWCNCDGDGEYVARTPVAAYDAAAEDAAFKAAYRERAQKFLKT
jgi:hypothetical protein